MNESPAAAPSGNPKFWNTDTTNYNIQATFSLSLSLTKHIQNVCCENFCKALHDRRNYGIVKIIPDESCHFCGEVESSTRDNLKVWASHTGRQILCGCRTTNWLTHYSELMKLFLCFFITIILLQVLHFIAGVPLYPFNVRPAKNIEQLCRVDCFKKLTWKLRKTLFIQPHLGAHCLQGSHHHPSHYQFQ